MDENSSRFQDIDNLLNKISSDALISKSDYSLRELFDNRIAELGIKPTYVLKILNINYRALDGILEGTQKRIDFVTLTKLARFLGITNTEIVKLYVECLEEKNPEDIDSAKRRTFITDNFDLGALKTIGIIESIRDFAHIENKLTLILGLNSIYDYNANKINAAFSSGKINPKNSHSRSYFIQKSESIFKIINNPNFYSKESLVDYFPKIRWHSTDNEKGLANVIRSLYKLGVTIIYQPKIPALHLRGATFAVNDKPCIVLTDYKGNYPTMWFALIHELFHVIFDWPEILNNEYHLSDEDDDLEVVRQKENEANDFAREYLFPNKKMAIINDKINNPQFIKDFALDNHVHPSIIYANYAYDNENKEDNLWGKFNKHMPSMNALTYLGSDLGHKATSTEYATFYKQKLISNS